MSIDDFGFDGEDWLDQARASEEPITLGNIGEFELLEEVGRGGQGVVWKARQPGTDRVIALKKMLAGSLATTTMRKRFEREIEAAASLSHPGIVTVYAMELIDDQPVLAMEWVDGVPCTDFCKAPVVEGDPDRCGDPRATLELFLRIADAVNHAHSRGIVHRDLKPSNILVDKSGACHVLDFGLAKRMDSSDEASLTGTGQILGTPAYASPEQLRSSLTPVDERSDVYSLGVVLFEMLTARRPYPNTTSVIELLAAVEHQTPKRPSTIDGRLTSEHDAIVLKAMAKDPTERYESLGAFAVDVRALLEGTPVGAVVPSSLYYLRKLVGRNRAASALLFGLVSVSAGFGGYSVWQADKLRASNLELEQTVERLTESNFELDSARSVIASPTEWVQAEADSTLKDFLPPCLVEPEATTNFERESKDFDQDFWGDN